MKKFHIILLLLLVLTNWLFAWRLQQTMAMDFYYGNALWTLGSFVLWGIILSLNLVLIKNTKFEILALVLGSAGFLVNGLNIFILSAIILLILVSLYTKKYIREQLDNLIKIRVYDTLYYGIWYFMVAVFILISAIYYTSPQLENYQFDLTIPPRVFDSIFKAITPMLEGLNKTGLDMSYLTNSIQQQTQTAINNSIGNIVESYKNYIPGILVLSLFFGLQILNWPLRMLIAFLTTLIIRPLIGFGAIKKETIQIEKEMLV